LEEKLLVVGIVCCKVVDTVEENGETKEVVEPTELKYQRRGIAITPRKSRTVQPAR
jgi:hypothetical protein